MNQKLHALLCALALTGGAASTLAADATETPAQRGKYLVERVVGCADCHSQRDQTGQFVASTWLGGADLPFAPTVPMPAWATHAPAIASLPSMSDADAIHLLMNGKKADGTMLRPPMPIFRLTEEDARAVVAYLRALPKVAQPAAH